MSYIVFAWTASLLFGFVTILAKLTSKYAIQNSLIFNFLYTLGLTLWVIPFALANHAGIPSHWENIIFAGVFYALSGYLYFTALAKLDVSTISPLYNFQTAFAVILAGIILHEHLQFFQYFLISFIFIAGMFTTADEKFKLHAFFKSAVLLAILGALSYAFSDVFVNRAVAQNGYWTASLWIPCVSLLSLCFTIPLFRKKLKKVSSKSVLTLFLIGGIDTMATLAAIRAYASHVGLSVVIVSLPISLLLAITLSFFLPNLLEKHTAKVYAIRLTATIIMVAAAVKLSLG